MKPFTQKEMLEEGFWDGFKKVAGKVGNAAKTVGKGVGAAATGLGRAVDIALPELTRPVKDVISGGRSVINATKQGWDLFKSKQEIVKKKLENLGYVLDESQPPQQIGDNFMVFASEITGYDKAKQQFIWDPNTTIPFLVDKNNDVKKAPGNRKPPAAKGSAKKTAAKKTPAKKAAAMKTPATKTATKRASSRPPITSAPASSPAPAPTPPASTPRRTGVSRGGPPNRGGTP